MHAYILMTNHVHLLLTPTHVETIPHVMQHIGRRYVQYFNYHYRRSGTLWEGRYKASLVDAERYLLTCYRYIEMNPVRAAMVSDPKDYPWSSHHYNAWNKPDALITPHALYIALDADPNARCSNYRELFRHHLDTATLGAIRESLNQEVVLGNDRFREQIEKAFARRARPNRRGRPAKQKQPAEAM